MAAPFRSLLVAVDLTPASSRVRGRVALLPLADGARITLLHVVPGSLRASAQRIARRDAKRALAQQAEQLRESLPRKVTVQPIVKVGSPAGEIAASAQRAKAELVVLGRSGERPLRELFLGSTAERVVRQGRLPVLVVRLAPRAAYRRPALALDLDRAAERVLALMLRLLPPPRPRVAVIHAFDAPYQSLAYPSLCRDEDERLRDLQLRASGELAKLLARSLEEANVPPKDAPVWATRVVHGSPRLLIEKAVKKAQADVLVLGTHGYAGVAHMFLGSVAGDVVRRVACDALIVPPQPPRR